MITLQSDNELDGVCGADVEPEAQKWLLDGWIPRGCPTILAGASPSFKSTVLTKIAADQSRGRLNPDSSIENRGGVIWVALTEPIDCVMVPRLKANDADLSQILDLHVANPNREQQFILPDDLKAMAAITRKMPIALAVVDPLMWAFDFKIDAIRNHRFVCDLTTRCLQFAEHFNLAMGVCLYSNKRGQLDCPEVFASAARSIIITSLDLDDEQR